MTEPFGPRGLEGSGPGSPGRQRRRRAAGIGRIVFFILLTLFFLLAGIGLVVQPALRWSGLVLVTLALITGAAGMLGMVELRGKPVRGGGPRATRWFFGTACVVCAWLATASALALGSGDRSAYGLVMVIVGAGGLAYFALAWWRFERAQRAKRSAAGRSGPR